LNAWHGFAEFADRIDLPVMPPTRLDVVINLKTVWERLGNSAKAARVRILQAEST